MFLGSLTTAPNTTAAAKTTAAANTALYTAVPKTALVKVFEKQIRIGEATAVRQQHQQPQLKQTWQ